MLVVFLVSNKVDCYCDELFGKHNFIILNSEVCPAREKSQLNIYKSFIKSL